ncbi:MAG TPA: DUF975 family protein [Terriglobales bacterium]|nr:DUF975 family protein [Terriglobales bacterium]
MTLKKFSKGEAIRFGWNAMKSNLGFFIGLLVVAGLISGAFCLLQLWVEKDSSGLSFILSIISVIVGSIIQMGMIRIALTFADNSKAKFGDLFSCAPLLGKYLISSILCGLIVLGGLILLIIPGIIWAIQFQFFSYQIIDKGAGPIEALKKSSAITKGSKWNLFLFFLLILGINILGLLALVIGLFATIPTSMVATAFVYRKLSATQEPTAEAQVQS